MKGKSIITMGLLLGISANSVFAGETMTGTDQFNSTMERLAQARRNANSAITDNNLAILNARKIMAHKNENKETTIKVKVLPNKPQPQKNAKKETPQKHTGRKETFLEEFNKMNKKGNRNAAESPGIGRSTPKKPKPNNNIENPRISRQGMNYLKLIYGGKNLNQLSAAQKAQIIKLHKQMLKSHAGQVVLATIQKGEGGGLLVLVGKGRGKSEAFKKIMEKLDTSTHPAHQFPRSMRCFFHNKQLNRCSTAAGVYQITKTNFDYYVRHLGIKDFSLESQQLIALELIRTGKASKVRGNYKGRGYVEMMRGNINNAIRYGTNDWASSPFSQWGGHKTKYLGDAQRISQNLQKKNNRVSTGNNENVGLKDQKFYQNWLDEFAGDRQS